MSSLRRFEASSPEELPETSKGKLSEERENMMIKARTETITKLLELGRNDLAEKYIEKLLETWVKTFLAM